MHLEKKANIRFLSHSKDDTVKIAFTSKKEKKDWNLHILMVRCCIHSVNKIIRLWSLIILLFDFYILNSY